MIQRNEPGEPLSRRRLLALMASAMAAPGALDFFSAWLQAAPQSHATHWQPPEPPPTTTKSNVSVMRFPSPSLAARLGFRGTSGKTALAGRLARQIPRPS